MDAWGPLTITTGR
jgi:signal transduction histidine kinase